MKSFKQYITEGKYHPRVKGWGNAKTGKLALTLIKGKYKPYHQEFASRNLDKLGLKEKDAIKYLDALDFVVQEWNKAMDQFEVEGQEKVSMEIYGNLMECRGLFIDLDGKYEVPFTEAIKVLGRLKQSMLGMAKSYARTPSLAHWYLSLPLIVHGC